MSVAPISTISSTQAISGSKKTDGQGFASALQAATGSPKSAAEQLQDYVDMTPAQRMRDTILKKLGLSEEEVAAMSPAEQKSVEMKIAELMKQEIQQQQQGAANKGRSVNISV